MIALGPVVDCLAWSLVGVLWKGMILWAFRMALDPLLPVRAVRLRYCVTAAALFGIPAWWIGSIVLALQAPVRPIHLAIPDQSFEFSSVLVGVWLTGVAVSGFRVGGGLWRWHRIVRRATQVPVAWGRHFADLVDRVGIHRSVRLLSSKRVDMPCVFGWLRPVVLIPGSLLTRLDREQLEAILLHELIHVRRLDWLAGLAQAAVESLLFHVPFVWLLSARLRAERENCCDDSVVEIVGDRHRYASALLSLEDAVRVPTWVPSARGGSLVKRIRRLVRPDDRSRTSVAAALLLLTATIGVASIVTLAGSEEGLPSWLPPDVSRWEPLLEQAAREHGLPPALLALMTLVESGGNPRAQSSQGATGLLQIMPSTAKSIALKRGMGGVDLRDPEVNLDLGAWYIARQLEAFDGNLELALAAYNGGPGRARRWVEEGQPLSRETGEYVALLAGLWSEREADESATYRGLWERISGSRLTAMAHPVARARVSQVFGNRNHRGVDLAAAKGTPILAPLDGEVISVSSDEKRGKAVVIRHGIGLETRYHHLESIGVEVGEKLAVGETLGTVGSTGVSTGPHLHFEVRENGSPVDPMGYLGD